MSRFRAFVTTLLLTIAIGFSFLLAGCHKPIEPNTQESEQGPLPTEGDIEPPRGCKELRERQGSC